jgi:putative membrane-bound dehydrogenase-like protein
MGTERSALQGAIRDEGLLVIAVDAPLLPGGRAILSGVAASTGPIAWLVSLLLGQAAPAPEGYSGLPAAGALGTFRVEPGFRIELVACEPDVIDPVSVSWDARGRLWVAEMSDYPLGPPGGRVRVLEDPDRDGRPERSRVFAEGLPFPTSVLPHRRGVLVSAAPDILYLEDADGDGRADERRAVLTGFAEGNTQLRVNSLLHGIDGRIYAANGRAGGKVRRPADAPERAIDIALNDVRFAPDTFLPEAIAGPSQFGHAFDAWGRRFLSWNTVHIREEILSPRDLERHPALASTETAAAISDHGDSARIHAIVPPPRTFNAEPTDHFNASCGLAIEAGGIFPPGHAGNAFVCEPLVGIVHRDVLVPGAGPALVARRGRSPGEVPGKEAEFLASTDPWFHPVNLRSGPDGALYVVDFYRELVEHPDYVRAELRSGIDFARGSGHGRIWRIVPEGAALLPVEDLEALGAMDLVGRLASPNGNVRETAARLLEERRPPEAARPLAELAAGAAPGTARALALWTLHRLGRLDRAVLSSALDGPDPRLREAALRLARESPFLADAAPAVIRLAADPDPSVRLQAALALGDLRAPRHESAALGALVAVAASDAGDSWMRAAVLSSLRGREAGFIEALARPGEREAGAEAMERILGAAGRLAGASGDGAAIRRALVAACSLLDGGSPAEAFAVAEGLASGVEAAGGRGLVEGADWTALHEEAARIAVGSTRLAGGTVKARDRLAAAALLAHAPAATALPVLGGLLGPAAPLDLQIAAARAAGKRREAAAARLLLDAWPAATPRLRAALLDGLASRAEARSALLEAIEAGTVRWRDVDLPGRESLRRALGPEGGRRLDAALRMAGETAPDRAAVIARYVAETPARGDSLRGAALFAQACAPCHRFAGKGSAVGPDLAGAGRKSRGDLIGEILDPGRSVVPGYSAYAIILTTGETVSGILASETATAITLRREGGAEESLERASIRRIAAAGTSFMPEGLESKLTPRDMADLLEHLGSGGSEGSDP